MLNTERKTGLKTLVMPQMGRNLAKSEKTQVRLARKMDFLKSESTLLRLETDFLISEKTFLRLEGEDFLKSEKTLSKPETRKDLRNSERSWKFYIESCRCYDLELILRLVESTRGKTSSRR